MKIALEETVQALWRQHHQSVRRLVIRGQHLKMKAEFLLRQNRPHQALFVFGSARCGSNLLVQLLDSHPQITMKNEVLSPWTITGLGAEFEEVSQARAMRHVVCCILHTKTAVSGVKLLQRQAKYFWITPKALNDKLPQAFFVLCYRRSLIDQYVSGLVADKTGAWVSGERKRVERPTVHVEVASFRQYCEDVQSANTELVEREFLGLRWMPIAYEDLCAAPNEVLEERVFKPLQLASHQPRTVLRKQNDRPLSQIIENYSEVEESLRAPWAQQNFAPPATNVEIGESSEAPVPDSQADSSPPRSGRFPRRAVWREATGKRNAS